jgi:hypothetical protein
MGWLFSSAWPTATAMRDHLRDELKRSGYILHDDALTAYGRRYWALISKPDTPPTIFHALLNGGRDHHFGGDMAWGYKDMDESMGPCDTDCPLRLLDKAGPPPNDWAKDWRDKVRAGAARRTSGAAIMKTAKKGDKVWLVGRTDPYTVSYRRKNSLIGYRADGAGPFRLPTKAIERHEGAPS